MFHQFSGVTAWVAVVDLVVGAEVEEEARVAQEVEEATGAAVVVSQVAEGVSYPYFNQSNFLSDFAYWSCNGLITGGRGGRSAGGGGPNKKVPTAEELDAELDAYVNQSK